MNGQLFIFDKLKTDFMLLNYCLMKLLLSSYLLQTIVYKYFIKHGRYRKD